MISAPIPENEAARLASLHRLRILDTPHEEAFDRLIRLTATFFNAPMAAISLVDADREWFKACTGIGACEGPRRFAFCSHAILKDGPMIVEDATKDPRFSDNPMVVEGTVRSYAGVPITSVDGFRVGVLCVKDRVARTFTTDQIARLADFARICADMLEWRLGQFVAQESARIKSEFLAGMSHELRTPMTAILGYSDALTDPDVTEEEARMMAATIRRNGDHLLAILNDLLDFSKIEAGQMRVECVSCNPVEILADLHALMLPRAEARGITLRAEFDPTLPAQIQTDPTRLRQILLNLLSNAVKFTELGSVVIRGRVLNDADLGRRLSIEVEDTGIGMTDEQLTRIAEPFVQADASTTRRFGGTGLGLAISRRLAELLGGRLDIRSAFGQGSTFIFTLPIGSGEPKAAVPPESADDASESPERSELIQPLSGVNILVAEDGRDNQRLLRRFLEQAGAQVSFVENGEDAVRMTARAASRGATYDLLLLDIQMPIMDGYTAARTLRKQGYRGPILALTAHSVDLTRAQCLDAGCTDCLQKPIAREALISAILRHLNRPAALAR